MKRMNLFLVGIILLLGFVSFAYAEVNNASDSFENETVVEINETLLDENQIEEVDVAVDNEEVVEDKKSFLNGVVSYVNGAVNKINEIHKNLFFIIIIILGVLSLFVYSIFFDYSSADVCLSKASSLHRRGERAHVNGNYTKAKKLYSKSYLFRARAEGIVSGRADDGAI